jgi:threonine dehydrogenase-like Zn-dependent dehydrogenase
LRFPRSTGYGNLGEVLATGSQVTSIKVGDVVASFGEHASHVKVDASRFCLRVPPELALDGRRAVFVRLVGVAATALRMASASPGDKVVVIGLGMVGNFAAQLFQLGGADVLATDTVDARRAIAARCGIAATANPVEESVLDRVLAWTGGAGADVVVEAIGEPRLAAEAVELARRAGEVVLLGSPRAPTTMDVTPMLTRIHLMGITVKGALEWTYPINPVQGAKHSIVRNYEHILRWMAAGRLAIDPLRTHVLPPARCAEAYDGLARRKDEYLGVVFDWDAGD